MPSSLAAFFYGIASWRTLLLGALLYIPFPAYIFRSMGERMNVFAGRAVQPIDVLIGYDPARIQQMVTTYGHDGRAAYAQGELTADLAYPLIYTFLLCIILSLLYRNRSYAPFRLVNVLPVGILFFDLLENSCIIFLLTRYPQTSATVASLCSVFTNVKWAVALVVIVLVLYGLVRLALDRRQPPALG